MIIVFSKETGFPELSSWQYKPISLAIKVHSIMVEFQITCMDQTLEASFAHLRHAAHSSHQQHFSDVTLGDLCVLHGLLTGCHGPADQIPHDALQLSAGQLHVQVFGAGGVHRQVRQVEVRLCAEIYTVTNTHSTSPAC